MEECFNYRNMDAHNELELGCDGRYHEVEDWKTFSLQPRYASTVEEAFEYFLKGQIVCTADLSPQQHSRLKAMKNIHLYS